MRMVIVLPSRSMVLATSPKRSHGAVELMGFSPRTKLSASALWARSIRLLVFRINARPSDPFAVPPVADSTAPPSRRAIVVIRVRSRLESAQLEAASDSGGR